MPIGRRTAVIAMVVTVVVAAVGAPLATAAENVHDGSVDPSTVEETRKVSHTFSFAVDNVSNDGNTDTLFLTFPDRVSQANLSSFSGNVTDVETGESVSISSSVSIVDGPDGDGVTETVSVGIQPEGERTTIDVLVTFTGDVTWPAVDSDTSMPLEASVTDSKFDDVTLVRFASVTVEDTDGGDPTPTPTESGDPTPTDSPTPTPTDTSGATATETPSPTPSPSPTPTDTDVRTDPTESPASPTPSATDADGPGFGVVVAVWAVLLAALLARRR